VTPSSYLPAQCWVGRLQLAAVQLGAGVVEAGDSAPDITQLGGVSFGLNGEIAGDADAFPGLDVLKGDPGRPDNVNVADGRAVQLRDRSAGPAEENIGYRGPLSIPTSLTAPVPLLERDAGGERQTSSW
jgi:hypothetical protein